MENAQNERITAGGYTFTTPGAHVLHVSGSSETSYSIEVSGTGSLTGLGYTVPAHATGSVSAKLNLLALTSEDVKNLNELAMSMLNVSAQEEIREYEKTHASANLSIWTWFFGGGGASASYEKTKETMKSKGLNEEQISKLMDAFLDIARSMSYVTIDFNIDNSKNDYSVSGNLYLYTVSGKITTSNGTREYRMLADKGSAGYLPSQGGAPSEGVIVPLN